MSSTPQTLKFTDEQQQALASHASSVSLAAGAGCGKTFVLTERFLAYLDPRILEPNAELHELVAITFTDAAAREMRDRIRKRCYQRLEQATDEREKKVWNRLIRSLDAARISTIHSFCGSLLRNHAAEAEVDPRFEMLDPPAAELFRVQTVDNRLRELLLSGDERVFRLATHFSLRSLRDHVTRLLGENPAAVVSAWGETDAELLTEVWQKHYRESVVPLALQEILTADPVLQLQELCQNAEVTKEGLPDHFAEIMSTIAALSGILNPGETLARLRELAQVRGVCKKKDWVDAEQYEQYKDTNKAVRDLIDKSILQDSLQQEPMLEAAELGLELMHLVGDVAQHYERLKQSRNALEFDDLLQRAHQLLTDERYPEIRKSLNKSTRLLMVDEFQDTDPLQVSIVKAFCGEEWNRQGLFVVGDFKQSIYRFRGAEPSVSNKLRTDLPERGQLSLTKNFRSQPGLLNFVNTLFHDAFEETYQPLQPSRAQVSEIGSVEFLWAAKGSETGEEDELLRRHSKAQRDRVREARFIARRLAELLDSEQAIVFDAASSTEEEPIARPLQLGDIAILLRSLSDVPIYEEALREQGLEYYLAGGHAFYAQQEIFDVLHLLRAVASRTDDLSLAGVLRSPIFSLSDETLFWLAQQRGSLNDSLFAGSLPPRLSDKEKQKVQRAAEILSELRQSKDRLRVAELLNLAIALTGYDAALLCEFLGERKLANIQKLIEQARTLDRTRPGDLEGFITQLTEFVVRTPKEPLAATQSEGDVIRIMTIHYSKGLEFPLVVVPDLSRSTHSGSKQPEFDELLGPLVPTTEPDTVVGWDMHHFAEQLEERQERKRLLYVACTRAADYLLLSSSVEDLEKPKSDWMKLIAQRFDLQTGKCLEAPPAGISIPEITVTLEQPPSSRKPHGRSTGADLEKMLSKTWQLVKNGKGKIPAEVERIEPDLTAQKRFSFSRLSGQLAEYRPPAAVATEVESAGLEFGRLVHAVLEQVGTTQQQELKSMCERLAPVYVEGDWQQAARDADELVSRFLMSVRAEELSKAKIVRREVEFVLGWPGKQQQFEGCFLHGFIDCLYQDAAGDWHLVDYKSNRVDAATARESAKHYEMQMFVYAMACEKALGVSPTESVLYYLRPGVEVPCCWDAQQRKALAEEVDSAMESIIRPTG